VADDGSAPHELVERALALSTGDACTVLLTEHSGVNLRWARNAVTTNGLARDRTVTVVVSVDGADGVAAALVTRNAAAAADVEAMVRAADAGARAAAARPDARPPVDVGVSAEFTAPPATTSPAVFTEFAVELGAALQGGRRAGYDWFGFAQHEVTTTYLGTSSGTRLRHAQPAGSVEITVQADDRHRTVWSGQFTSDFRDFDMAGVERELTRRLEWTSRQLMVPAGRYETLLPPAATADLVVRLYDALGGRDAVEGSSVFGRAGGNTALGELLCPLGLSLRSDPAEPGLGVAPFLAVHGPDGHRSPFDNGQPLCRTEWIGNGRLRNLVTSRHAADVTGLPFRPQVGNLVLDGGTATLDEMVANTRRGLLLTCLWYVRLVDRAALLLTGLTRDGVYLVENGEVVGSCGDLRFNESPVELLGRATQAGRAERTLPRDARSWFPRVVAPPLRIPDLALSATDTGT